MAKGRNPFFPLVEKVRVFLYGDKNRPFEKPRRIIESQALVQVLIVLATLSPVWAMFPVFYLIFGICPSVVVPTCFGLWVVAVIIYVVLGRIKSEE